MQMKKMRLLRGLFAAVLSLGLAACDMTVPSQLETGHIRLSEQTRSLVLDAGKPDEAAARQAAKAFAQNGRGGQQLLVPYLGGDPLQETSARKSGAAWQALLAKNGMPDVQVDYVAVEDAALLKRAVLSYNVLSAQAPDGCVQRLTGYQGGDTLEDMHSYRIGCETRTALSKMIVNPEDLRGRDGTAPADSRRQGIVAERHMSGEKSEALDTSSTSSVSD